MTYLITGATGAGKTTLALRMQEQLAGFRVRHLDQTQAWKAYRAEFKDDWDLGYTWSAARVQEQSLACWRALAEGLLLSFGRHQLVEGAQILPHCKRASSLRVFLLDTPKETCIAQHVKRKAAKRKQQGQAVTNSWLNACFNTSRRIYELWEPHIEAARQMPHVICLKPGEESRALNIVRSFDKAPA